MAAAETVSPTAVSAARTDERALFGKRQRRDIAAEVEPGAVAAEIVLDVREVVRRNLRVTVAQHAATARRALGPEKLPTTGTIRLADSRRFTTSKLASFARKLRMTPAASVIRISVAYVRRRQRGRSGSTSSRSPDRSGRSSVHVFDPLQLLARERQVMRLDQALLDSGQIPLVVRFNGRHRVEGGKEIRRRGVLGEVRRLRPREQQRHEFGAIGRQLEQRLVHQMQIAVAAPDVHDERDARLERGDVGEVLLGPDAEIDAARTDPRNELGNDRLVAGSRWTAGCPTGTARATRTSLRTATRTPGPSAGLEDRSG